MKLTKARKEYTCCITGQKIKIGEEYIRKNIKGVGIYHFKKHIDDNQIKNHIYPDIFYNASPEKQKTMCDPLNYDSFEQEIWADMPDEF